MVIIGVTYIRMPPLITVLRWSTMEPQLRCAQKRSEQQVAGMGVRGQGSLTWVLLVDSNAFVQMMCSPAMSWRAGCRLAQWMRYCTHR
jgi:hypothetical protein